MRVSVLQCNGRSPERSRLEADLRQLDVHRMHGSHEGQGVDLVPDDAVVDRAGILESRPGEVEAIKVDEVGERDEGLRDYLEKHVATCVTAVERGLPLAGYFFWSLMDNFEWVWGNSRRFGLVHVDYETQHRTVKKSGRWYSEFLTENG